MRRNSFRHVVVLAAATWCSEAWAVDQVTAERIRAEVAHYAQLKGETLEHFVDRIGSPLQHIESFVHNAEQGGGTADDALGRLDRFVSAMADPAKRRLLKCLGIRIPQDVDPPPSPIACAVLEQRFGIQ